MLLLSTPFSSSFYTLFLRAMDCLMSSALWHGGLGIQIYLSGFVAHRQYLRCLSTLDLLRYKSFVIAAVPSCLSCASPFKAFGFVLQAVNGVTLFRLCGSQAVTNSSSLQIFPDAESLVMAALPAYWSCDLGCRIYVRKTKKFFLHIIVFSIPCFYLFLCRGIEKQVINW